MEQNTNSLLSNDLSSLPRGEQAYQFILRAIQRSEFKPGDRLREGDLAEHIGLSRTPVREALWRLEADGLIANDPVRGMMVAELDYSMISELYTIREILEGTAARLAAQHASDVELIILREIFANYKNAGNDSTNVAERNRQFHDAIYRCAHNRYLLKTLRSLHHAMALLGETTLVIPARFEKTIEEHEAIVDAIVKREPDLADANARAHIRSAQQVRLKRIYSSPSALADGP